MKLLDGVWTVRVKGVPPLAREVLGLKFEASGESMEGYGSRLPPLSGRVLGLQFEASGEGLEG